MSNNSQWDTIYNEFEVLMPLYADKTVDWYPSGQFEITVKLDDGTKLIFDYLSKTSKFIFRSGIEEDMFVEEEGYRDEFSRRLRRKMHLRGISQEELAEAADISRRSLSNYMNGYSTPSSYIAAKLARILNCSVTELVDFI